MTSRREWLSKEKMVFNLAFLVTWDREVILRKGYSSVSLSWIHTKQVDGRCRKCFLQTWFFTSFISYFLVLYASDIDKHTVSKPNATGNQIIQEIISPVTDRLINSLVLLQHFVMCWAKGTTASYQTLAHFTIDK